MAIQPLDIATTAAESLTLLDLQRMVRFTLEERFNVPLWVGADISELKLNRSGHCYLNLVEKGAGEGTPLAEARAVIWRSAYATLVKRFADATGSELRAGMRIMARVVVTYHEVYGFSLQIIDIDPTYTLGEVERRRRETIARLQSDGVWDMNREVELPCPVLRIAVVSSATAAGYEDFVRELGRSPFAFRVTLFEAGMQGDAAEQSIVDALAHIAESMDDFDVVAMLRGGGSTSDLALFDSYRLASHVAQFPLPVFTGIGHDRDVSVVDMVAHTMCKTPTAVATHIVELAMEQWALLDSVAQQVRDMAVSRLATERLALERNAAELGRSAVVLLNNANHRLDVAERGVIESARRLVQYEWHRVERAQDVIDSRSVESILRCGFAVVRDKDGGLLHIDDVGLGSMLSIELYGGSIEAEARRIDRNDTRSKSSKRSKT